MGMFAFRRLRELEAASNEAASLSIAEPTPSLDTNTKPKRRGRLKQLSQPKDDGETQAD
jgi:hypothetical protein